MTVGDDDN